MLVCLCSCNLELQQSNQYNNPQSYKKGQFIQLNFFGMVAPSWLPSNDWNQPKINGRKTSSSEPSESLNTLKLWHLVIFSFCHSILNAKMNKKDKQNMFSLKNLPSLSSSSDSNERRHTTYLNHKSQCCHGWLWL